jgi:hypothetical protein
MVAAAAAIYVALHHDVTCTHDTITAAPMLHCTTAITAAPMLHCTTTITHV